MRPCAGGAWSAGPRRAHGGPAPPWVRRITAAVQPVGSTAAADRWRVMPFDLACRSNTRRRSWALADLTRYRCSQRQQRTPRSSAMMPVRSTTHLPADPASPDKGGLSPSPSWYVGTACAGTTIVPARSTRRWACDPRSLPTTADRHGALARLACSAAPVGGAGSRPRPIGCADTAPTMCFTGPGLAYRAIPHPHRGRTGWHRSNNDGATRPSQADSTPPPNPPGCSATLEPVLIQHRCPLYELLSATRLGRVGF